LEDLQAFPVYRALKSNFKGEEEYGALVKCHCQEKIEILGIKPTLLPLFPPQIPEERKRRIRRRKRRRGCNEKFVSYYKKKQQIYFCIDSQALPPRPSAKGRVEVR
jgi:hypothetical protein